MGVDSAARQLYRRLPAWAMPGVVALGAVTAVATVGLMDPEVRGHLVPACPFRAATGLDCPGCGTTRAVFALTRGDLTGALDHNVLTVLAIPLLAVAWLAWLRWRTGRRARPLVLAPSVSMGLAGAIMVFWVARNLPWQPLAWFGSGVG